MMTINTFSPPVDDEKLLSILEGYTMRGWKLFPVRMIKDVETDKDGNTKIKWVKAPFEKRGFHTATTDMAQIRTWMKKYPGCMWATPMDNIFAVDCDQHPGAPDGLSSLTSFLAEHGEVMPPTLIQRTAGGGGYHFLFKAPDGVEIKTGVKFLPGVDTRGGGKGYIVIAPSINPYTKQAYTWIDENVPMWY